MKKGILCVILLIIGMSAFGQLQRIKMGTGSNTGTGDSWPTAWRKADKVIELVNWNRLYTIDASELAVLNGAGIKPKHLQMLVGLDTTKTLQAQLNGKADTSSLSGYVAVGDTSVMLQNYARLDDLPAAGISIGTVQDEIADSLNLIRAAVVMTADTSAMLANYTRNGELNSALDSYVAVGDTATMLSNYAKLSDLSEGGVSIDAVQDEIADSLNVLRPLVVMAADTASMLSNYAKLSDLTEGGISIDAVQDEIADSLNVLRPLVVMAADTSAMLGNYTRNGELASALGNYLAEADTATMLGNYTRNGELNAALGNYLAEADTATMLSNYARNGEVAASYAPKNSPTFTTQATMPATTYLPSGSVMSWNNGDMMLTHSNNKLSFDGGNVSIGSFNLELTGTVGTITDRALYGYFTWLDVTNVPTIGGMDIYTLTAGQIQDSLDARMGAGIELGDVALLKADSTGNAPGNYVTHKALVDSLANAGVGVSIEDVRDEIADSLNTRIGEGLELGDLAVMQADTMLYFAPVIGMGQVNDTTLFSTGDILYGFRWGGSYDLVLTSITGVVYGTSPDIDIAVLKDVNYRDATPTTVLTADLTITSTTTGNTATSFSAGTIAPGEYVWIRVDQCTAPPTQCLISIYGYLQR